MFGGCSVRMKDGHWQAVSLSLRNPVTRKALDYLNARLDAREFHRNMDAINALTSADMTEAIAKALRLGQSIPG